MAFLPWLAMSATLAIPAEAEQAWSYAAQPGWRVFFHGVADPAGNLYWAECSPQALCDIVSASNNGAIRFRVPAGNAPLRGAWERGRLVAWRDLVIDALQPGGVRARRSSDGGEVWSRALGPVLCAGGRPPAPSALNLHSITAGRNGEVFLEAHGDPCGTGSRQHWIVSLSATTGAVRWTKVFDRSPSELVADELGNLFFRTELASEGKRRHSFLMSLSSTGHEQWRAEASWTARPIASAQGWLFDAERSVWRTSTASVAFRLPLESAWAGQRNAFTLVDDGLAFIAATPKGQCRGPDCPLRLYRVDLAAGKIEWSTALGSADRVSITSLILTSDRSVLLAENGEFSTLREFSSDGREIRSDRLPAGNYCGVAALVGNRWVAALGWPTTQLRAFDTQVGAAPRGWMSWCGDPGCTGRPQEERPAVAAHRPARR